MNETALSAHLSKHRIEALIDGIFAVVMTLLVIDLRLPEHAHDLGEAAIRHALVELFPNFESWVISFVVLAIFWVASHRLFTYVRHLDATLVRWTMLMLAGASLLPFAAAVNSQSSTQIGQIVYSSVLIVMGLPLLRMWNHIYRSPELQAHHMDRHTFVAASVRSVGLMMIALLTIPLAYAVPGKANMAYGLMFLLRPAAEYIGRRASAPVATMQEEDEAASTPAA
ncbi:MAG: TMEM175 family protein [Telluria sp.]